MIAVGAISAIVLGLVMLGLAEVKTTATPKPAFVLPPWDDKIGPNPRKVSAEFIDDLEPNLRKLYVEYLDVVRHAKLVHECNSPDKIKEVGEYLQHLYNEIASFTKGCFALLVRQNPIVKRYYVDSADKSKTVYAVPTEHESANAVSNLQKFFLRDALSCIETLGGKYAVNVDGIRDVKNVIASNVVKHEDIATDSATFNAIKKTGGLPAPVPAPTPEAKPADKPAVVVKAKK